MTEIPKHQIALKAIGWDIFILVSIYLFHLIIAWKIYNDGEFYIIIRP